MAGEIYLDGFKQSQDNAKAKLYTALNLEVVPDALQGREGAARLLSAIAVHSSGLSIYGKTQLPWQDESIAAPFQLTKIFPDVSPNSRQFRLTLERERLTKTEQKKWSEARNLLSIYLNPKNPLNGIKPLERPTPHWVTLEITNPSDVPHLYWQISTWTQAPKLQFATDEINVLLSDQQPYDQENPPTSLARVVPDEIAIARLKNPDGSRGGLELIVRAGAVASTTGQALSYVREKAGKTWQETVTLSNLKIAFSPVETPQFLRSAQGLTEPEWLGKEPINPAILWGFMPLENGWAQLPVPNLTEQIYLDSGLAKFIDTDPPSTPPKALLQGAVSLGNDRAEVLKKHPSEQPWNITLTNAQRLQEGRWILEAFNTTDINEKFQLQSITLNLLEPDVSLNGLFWLSSGKPTPEDALPDLENWISGLRSISLTTVKPGNELFPSPIVITLQKLELSLRTPPPPAKPDPQPSQSTLEPPSALLKGWTFTYQVDEAVFAKLVENDEKKKVLPADIFSQFLPWIWQRHASLPMVQALPLTQSQSPPSYPSASRQLVPFELDVASSQDGKFMLPHDWTFAVSGENAATSWLQLMREAPLVPAREWQSLFDLPLVSLSIPGLILDPKADSATMFLVSGWESIT